MGVETADENVMKLIDKTQDRKQPILVEMQKVGIKIKVCLILGLKNSRYCKKDNCFIRELEPTLKCIDFTVWFSDSK